MRREKEKRKRKKEKRKGKREKRNGEKEKKNGKKGKVKKRGGERAPAAIAAPVGHARRRSRVRGWARRAG